MKIIFTFLFLIINIHGFCQPGPVYRNIDKISDENFLGADVIVIDSTSDLTKISKLKNSDRLQLTLYNLREIPKEFKNFFYTTTLTLNFYNVKNDDLSFLNEFPNLKSLSIYGYEGETLSFKDLKLNALSYLYIGDCGNLHDINAIRNLNSLEELSIFKVAYLKEFPKFSKQNLIKKLIIEQGSNGRTYDNKIKNFKTDVRNIKNLRHLEEITLGSLTHIDEIPDYLPLTIKKIKIDAGSLHHEKDDKVIIKNMNNLKLYSELKELKLSYVHLEVFQGNFENISLDYLSLDNIPDLTDISGVFSFKSIRNLRISNCRSLKTISGSSCENKIGKIEIDDCPRIENVDFLFTCKSLNSIEMNSELNTLKLSGSTNMSKIPNISIFNSNDKIRLLKKDNIWEIKTVKK
ncbi:hypothetical protein NZ698_07595 [Chryseobacterium sp. PBS4-4]|uniref:R13L1/DRL21-like LRR repeat region domain-containing protein n=1 Tax=Chryseobacterium edaphi TaxID=2976532 RepID=A0ABT2W714_9FLAO|nr:hypothetical protein [Chryseobacterium edaphi]MCU7617057.1 hypothetical protein [Chryseobacterium edaphi]